MIRLFLCVISLGLMWPLFAQPCGTPSGPIMERMLANRKNLIELKRGAVKYVPVTYHLVAATNGTGRVEEENVLKQVANINAAYADQEFVFYIDSFNYFNNDAVYNTPHSPAARTQMNLRKDKNALNVFITNTANDGGGSPGTVLAYYDPQGDWIVSRKNEINGASSTLSHETGHFFSLPHPFNGWDCHPYNTTEYTNPVNVDFTIPCETGGGSVLIELHDRSNCLTAGDQICDTPEDYNLGLNYQPNNCDENNTIMDKNGQVIKPMTNNFMSYYNNCASYAFTATQKNLMNTDFYSFDRQYIRTGKVPNTTPVTQPVNYISPINGVESNGSSNILLDWEDTPGANRYLVIYDRFASFTFSPVKTIVRQSQLTIPGPLTENVTYYWKVWPYNESQTDAMYSATQNFKVGTGTGVNEITQVQDYALSPNPSADHLNPVLTLFTIKAFDANLKVVDASGRVLSERAVQVPSGPARFDIEAQDLPAGVYFVVLHSETGNLIERLLLLE